MVAKEAFPSAPFLTVDFTTRTRGTDFLGMRPVNIAILARHLIPGLNNGTWDLGTYFLGTWIAWKFERLCGANPKLFVRSRFAAFSEGVQVGMANTIREESAASKAFGQPYNRMGVTQELEFDEPPSFDSVGRTNATNLYAPAQYGPSLRRLGLIGEAGSATADSRPTGVPFASTDQDTREIAEYVDARLKCSSYYKILEQLPTSRYSAKALDDLGVNGLSPAVHRDSGATPKSKDAFARKLIGAGDSPRTLTARLILQTIGQSGKWSDLESVREAWYTGLLPSGAPLTDGALDLVRQRQLWSVFIARQYQRLIVERWLQAFELALVDGARSISDATDRVLETWAKEGDDEPPKSLLDLALREGRVVSNSTKLDAMSAGWNQTVNGIHGSSEFTTLSESQPQDAGTPWRALARWWLRVRIWPTSNDVAPLYNYGGSEHLGLKWFLTWIDKRKEQPFRELVQEALHELIFAQHLRTALARQIGTGQRLRFLVADQGIVPTAAALKLMGSAPRRTQDRLESFVSLLEDLEVVEWDDRRGLRAGPATSRVGS
jgi:hypothetical protein